MSCKLHLPAFYDPIRSEHRCLCGAVRVSDVDVAHYGGILAALKYYEAAVPEYVEEQVMVPDPEEDPAA